MGKVNGYKIMGFDIGNFAHELSGMDIVRRRIIYRSAAGTQGVVRSPQADDILVA